LVLLDVFLQAGIRGKEFESISMLNPVLASADSASLFSALLKATASKATPRITASAWL